MIMKKTIFYSLFLFAALSFVCCSDDDDDPNEEEIEDLLAMDFGVDHGTVTYNNDVILYFTEKGKKLRIEYKNDEENADEVSSVIIYDRTKEECYMLYPEEKKYMKTQATLVNSFIYLGDDTSFARAGATKSDKTIAGKKCSVWKWTEEGTTYEYGGYKRIIMLSKDKTEKLEATSFSDNAPSVSFTVPSDYTLMTVPSGM